VPAVHGRLSVEERLADPKEVEVEPRASVCTHVHADGSAAPDMAAWGEPLPLARTTVGTQTVSHATAVCQTEPQPHDAEVAGVAGAGERIMSDEEAGSDEEGGKVALAAGPEAGVRVEGLRFDEEEDEEAEEDEILAILQARVAFFERELR
jgi:hypothetical protein